MVLPVIGYALYLIGCAVVGYGIGYGIDILIKKIGSKKVVVLGSRTAGKTTLATFLSTGTIPVKYEQTIHGVSKKGRRIELKELKLNPSSTNNSIKERKIG